jgi:hypothetical protein
MEAITKVPAFGDGKLLHAYISYSEIVKKKTREDSG